MNKESTDQGRPPHQKPTELQLRTWNRDTLIRDGLQIDKEPWTWDLQERIKVLRRDAAEAC